MPSTGPATARPIAALGAGDGAVSGSAAGSLIAAAGLAPLLVATPAAAAMAGSRACGPPGVGVLAADLLHSPISRLRVDATDRPLLAVRRRSWSEGCCWRRRRVVVHRRWPWLLLLAAVAAAPARIPVHAGGAEANLLLPLYAVIAAAGWPRPGSIVRGTERPPELGRLGWAAAAFIGWSAISMMWTADSARERSACCSSAAVRLSAGQTGGAAAWTARAAAGAGRAGGPGLRVRALSRFWQFATKDVFWNPKIIVGNEYASFFRVNSLFYDASIYGRFMAVTIVLLAGVAVYRRMAPPLVALIAVLFAGHVRRPTRSPACWRWRPGRRSCWASRCGRAG